MTHLHPVFALALLLEAFGVLWLMRQWVRVDLIETHFPTIDGLRGFLAFGVFVHHASIWFVFLETGAWRVPESRLYAHLGQSTVSLFFMITGFLFFGKILRNRQYPIDWLRLYVSRCLRILPLYFLVMLVGIAVIALIRYSGWVQATQAPWAQKSLTGLFTAGVTWTLSYEWEFYFSLPLVALLFGRVPWTWLLFSGVALWVMQAHKSLDMHACAFVIGMVSALLVQQPAVMRFARTHWGNAIASACLMGVVANFDTAHAIGPLLLLGVAFGLISNGAGLWGLLTSSLPRTFGEFTYSIYLLHGPLLFIVFRFVLGYEKAASLDALQYWGLIALLVPLLLGISLCSYRKLEQPFMARTEAWTARCRALIHKMR